MTKVVARHPTRGGRGRPSRQTDERGVVLLIFAMSISAMLVLAAFVLGGSLGYSAVRNAQNGADAAALAATSTLRDVKNGDASPSEVLADAISVAEDNGADPGSTTCEIVNGTYALSKSEADVIGPCTPATVRSLTAAGVRVTTGDTRAVPFGAFVDSDTITGDASATATAQPIRDARAPFMVCSAPTATGHPALPLISAPGLSPPFQLNSAAIGLSYVVQGNEMTQGGRDCGNGSSSWRGLVNSNAPFPIPASSPVDDSDWWQIETGNKNGPIPSMLAGSGSCSMPNGEVGDLQVGCKLLLPICTAGNGSTGSNFRLYCVRVAQFEISYIGKVSSGTAPCHPSQRNNIVCADLVGPGTAAVGTGGADTPQADDVVVVRLVE